MDNSKNDAKCNDCDSKNVTINYLNERINNLQKPVTTSYITKEYSPIKRYVDTTETTYTRPTTYTNRVYASPIRRSYVSQVISPKPMRTSVYKSSYNTYEPRVIRKSITYDKSPSRRYVDTKVSKVERRTTTST